VIEEECGEILERGLSDSEKDLVVRIHNERRAFVANGMEKRGDPGMACHKGAGNIILGNYIDYRVLVQLPGFARVDHSPSG
jgi:hypothetical protein